MSRPTDRWLPAILGAVLLLLFIGGSLANVGLLRPLLVVPIVLLLPGYALVRAFFPDVRLPAEASLLLALALSLAALILGGLVLHWTGWGIRPDVQLAVVAAITLLALTASMRRWWHQGDGYPHLLQLLTGRDTLLLGMALLVVVIAFSVARQPAPPSGSEGYTALSIAPTKGAGTADFTVRVQSMELGSTVYRLALRVDGREVKEWSPIALKPGQQWETAVRLSGDAANVQMVEAVLYRLGAPDVVYRYVRLWPDFQEKS